MVDAPKPQLKPSPSSVPGCDAKLFERRGSEGPTAYEWKGTSSSSSSKEPSAAADGSLGKAGQAAAGGAEAAASEVGAVGRKAVEEMVRGAVEDGLEGVVKAVQQMHVEMVRIDTLAAGRMAAMEGLLREVMEENLVLRREVERLMSLGNPYI
jgi:hypothetical protein